MAVTDNPRKLTQAAMRASFGLLSRRPRLFARYYRNIVITVGLYIFVHMPIFGGFGALIERNASATALHLVAMVLATAFGWYLSSISIATLVLTGIGAWRDSAVDTVAASGQAARIFREAVLGDALGSLVLFATFLGVLLPQLLPRTLVAAPAGITNYAFELIATACISAFASIYSALAMRRIVVFRDRPGAALLSAHREVIGRQSIYLCAAAANIILSFALQTLVATLVVFAKVPFGSGGAVDIDFGIVPLALVESLFCIAAGGTLWAMQLLPSVWLVDHFAPLVSGDERSGSFRPRQAIYPPYGFVAAFIALYIVAWLPALRQINGMHLRIEIQHIDVRPFGLQHVPRGFMPLRAVSAVMRGSHLREFTLIMRALGRETAAVPTTITVRQALDSSGAASATHGDVLLQGCTIVKRIVLPDRGLVGSAVEATCMGYGERTHRLAVRFGGNGQRYRIEEESDASGMNRAAFESTVHQIALTVSSASAAHLAAEHLQH